MDATNDTPIATDIYERLEMNKEGMGGSVHSDLEEVILEGDFQAFEDYFGDTDPFEFL
jgi:hypothetical protein